MKALHGTNFKLIMANLQNYFCNHHFHCLSTTASALLLCITLILKPFSKRRSTNSSTGKIRIIPQKYVTPRTVRASFSSALNFGSATNTKFANNASTVIIIIFAHTSTKPSPLAFALCSHPCQHTISPLIQMQPGRHDVIAPPTTTIHLDPPPLWSTYTRILRNRGLCQQRRRLVVVEQHYLFFICILVC